LIKGENIIDLWVEDDTKDQQPAWRVMLSVEDSYALGSKERKHHPNRSAKSRDGGTTWDDQRLGARDSADGEYGIRLSLDRYVKAGEYISPVMDVVTPDHIIKPVLEYIQLHMQLTADIPNETKITLFQRSGASPDPDSKNWTSWKTIDHTSSQNINLAGRYFQWKAVLETENPLISPRLVNLKLQSSAELSSIPESEMTAEIIHNGRVIRSSYEFLYENPAHPALAEYRKKCDLDKVVKGARTEFEKILKLMHWAYRIPVNKTPYTWDWRKVVHVERDSQGHINLQNNYKRRRRDAMCLYSNQALIGALLSFGLHARHININSEAMSGHEVTEVWSNEYNKWIYLDATRDYYYFDLATGIPLNLLEIHHLLAEAMPRPESIERPFVPEIGGQVVQSIEIGIRQGDNPFPIEKDARHLMETMGYFRIIPRNNFLSQPLPIPVAQGSIIWGWDGYIHHYDEMFPKRPEHQRQSNRRMDFYEPLNQSEIHLFPADTPGKLEVSVRTHTPGFEAFLSRTDEERSWIRREEHHWLWKLRPGPNMLEVKTLNSSGVTGPVSRIAVNYHP
jgi:hypothetical protein